MVLRDIEHKTTTAITTLIVYIEHENARECRDGLLASIEDIKEVTPKQISEKLIRHGFLNLLEDMTLDGKR